MRYSSQAQAEMAFERFAPADVQAVAEIHTFANSNGSVEAFVISKSAQASNVCSKCGQALRYFDSFGECSRLYGGCDR